jgi:hypothetical protein
MMPISHLDGRAPNDQADRARVRHWQNVKKLDLRASIQRLASPWAQTRVRQIPMRADGANIGCCAGPSSSFIWIYCPAPVRRLNTTRNALSAAG